MAYALLKHGLKRLVGGMAACSGRWGLGSSPSGIVHLMYHRVADTGCSDLRVDDWNVLPLTFERQVARLVEAAECLALAEVPRRLAEPGAKRPMIVITFDDGYGNFFTEALPVLQRYGVPAAVFLVTRFVGSREPFSFDRWGQRNRGRTPPDSWLPMTWRQIDACLSTGLVTFGSHSDTHPEGAKLKPQEMEAEVNRSRATLLERLGEAHAWAYAYPYGSTRLGHVNGTYREMVGRAGFTLGLTTDLGVALPGVDRLRLPRVEVHGSDGPAVVAAKAQGVLWPYRLTDALRQGGRSAGAVGRT